MSLNHILTTERGILDEFKVGAKNIEVKTDDNKEVSLQAEGVPLLGNSIVFKDVDTKELEIIDQETIDPTQSALQFVSQNKVSSLNLISPNTSLSKFTKYDNNFVYLQGNLFFLSTAFEDSKNIEIVMKILDPEFFTNAPVDIDRGTLTCFSKTTEKFAIGICSTTSSSNEEIVLTFSTDSTTFPTSEEYVLSYSILYRVKQ